MKNNTVRSLLFLLALSPLAFAPAASAAPTQIPTTTLSAAVNNTQPFVFLASLTGVNGPGQPVANGTLSAPAGAAWTILYVDTEAIRVTTTPGSVAGSPVYVERGWAGTGAEAHNSAALVWVGTPQQFNYAVTGLPAGACTYASLTTVPYINLAKGTISNCLGGQWVTGSGTAASHIQSPVTGATLATSLPLGTAMPVTDMGCIEVDMPGTKLLTGIGLLNGATASTDNHLVALYDGAGNLLANSATAGVLAAGASDYQYIPFTSKYFAVGPALYYACYQTNGTTGLVHLAAAASGGDTVWAGYIAAQTFGTIPSTITVPTTFTTAQGPMIALY
jgi:hypothetical protein